MNVEQLQQELFICFSTNDPIIQNAAQTANQYTELMKNGQISGDEYVELMSDIQRTVHIDQSMGIFETQQRLHTAINGLITLAKLV